MQISNTGFKGAHYKYYRFFEYYHGGFFGKSWTLCRDVRGICNSLYHCQSRSSQGETVGRGCASGVQSWTHCILYDNRSDFWLSWLYYAHFKNATWIVVFDCRAFYGVDGGIAFGKSSISYLHRSKSYQISIFSLALFQAYSLQIPCKFLFSGNAQRLFTLWACLLFCRIRSRYRESILGSGGDGSFWSIDSSSDVWTWNGCWIFEKLFISAFDDKASIFDYYHLWSISAL